MKNIVWLVPEKASIHLLHRHDEDQNYQKNWSLYTAQQFNLTDAGASVKVLGGVGFMLVEEGHVAVAQDADVRYFVASSWTRVHEGAFISRA